MGRIHVFLKGVGVSKVGNGDGHFFVGVERNCTTLIIFSVFATPTLEGGGANNTIKRGAVEKGCGGNRVRP